MMTELNRDEEFRDEIIFGDYEPDKYMGGVRNFNGLTLEKLKELSFFEFLDPEESHNSCPNIATIMHFMEEYQGYEACGYTVSAARTDYRVSITGLAKSKGGFETREELVTFEKLFGNADEFRATSYVMSCWFD